LKNKFVFKLFQIVGSEQAIQEQNIHFHTKIALLSHFFLPE